MRAASSIEIKIAVLFKWAGGNKYEVVASTLRIGSSTNDRIVKDGSRAIHAVFCTAIRLPTSLADMELVMNGSQRISGLSYCVDAIYGSRIK